MKIPKGWQDITIEQFIQLLPSNYKSENVYEDLRNKLAVLLNVAPKDLESMTLTEAKEIDSNMKFLSELPRDNPKLKFVLKRKWYRVILNANQSTFGTYISTMHIFKGLEKDQEHIEKNLHLILSQIIKRQKWNWKKFKYEDVQIDLMELAEYLKSNLTMDIAYPIIVFFCNLSKILIPITEDYLMQKVEIANKELLDIQKDLHNGGGL